MPGGISRQGGRRCALCFWCGWLVLGIGVCSSAVAGDDAADSASSPNVAPSTPRDRQFALVVFPDGAPQPGGPPPTESMTRQQAHGRALLEERIKVVKRPTSSRAAHKAALAALPLDKMADEHRRRILQIGANTSLFRELPTLQFSVDPRVYRFFMDHPEVAVNIWRVMQISEFHMRETGREVYETDDGAGTGGVLDVAYRDESQVVVLCDGVYKSPLLPTAVKARGALQVQVAFDRRPDGKTFATHSAKLFVNFPSQTVEAAARIISPISNAIIDQNFREVSMFLHMMSVAMQRQPGWVEYLSSRLDDGLAARRNQLMEVTVEVFADANPALRQLPRRPEALLDLDPRDHGDLPLPSRIVTP
jgi:hypothetical protein